MIKVNEYMGLDNLAKVLDELVNKFSGISLIYVYSYIQLVLDKHI